MTIEDKVKDDGARKEPGCFTLIWGVPSAANYGLAIYNTMQDNYDLKKIGFFLVMGTLLGLPAVYFGKAYKDNK